MSPSSDAEVELRVRDALERIEIAQNELSRACADLSAIVGAIPFWNKASALSGRCRQLWYALEGRDRRRWKLDGMHAREPGPGEMQG